MAANGLVRTGIAGLDRILAGGIPRGNVVLLEGGAGTGKSVLGVEFVYRGALAFGQPGVIVLFEQTPEKLMRDMAGFGWDLAGLERQGLLKIILMSRPVFEQELQASESLLLEAVIELGAHRLFVESITGIGTPGPPALSAARDDFNTLLLALQRHDITAMLASETSAEDGAHHLPPGYARFLADTVCLLRAEPVGRAVMRSIEILKSRGHDAHLGRHTMVIIDGRGVEVYRRVQAPGDPEAEATSTYDTSVRLPSGIPGLDELLHGGFWRGATSVLAGISGSGKSVMGLQFIAEGVRRGERGLMVTLDESPAQVMQNAAAIDIDLQAAIDRDLARLWYDLPQELQIDRHFARLEQLVAEFRPKRVVVDSLSTYPLSLGIGDRRFRDFFHALTILMKQHGATAIYNYENPELLGMDSMMSELKVSSVVDTIILLNFIELGDRFRHGLTVAKMRASPIKRTTYECEIADRVGLRVLPRPLATAPEPFRHYQSLIARSPERHLAPAGDDGRPPGASG
jgi:circadian clock protein KaiC